MKDARLYLLLALQAAQRVKDYLPATEAAFDASPLLQDAICMRLQVVGENLSKVRKQFPDRYKAHATPHWHTLIGLRNAISHIYAEVDMDEVWRIASSVLDELMVQLNDLSHIKKDQPAA